MILKRLLKDIKDLKIQGAESVALAALKYFDDFIGKAVFKDSDDFVTQLNHIKKQIENVRPTEPCLRNTLKYIFDFHYNQDVGIMKGHLSKNIRNVRKHFRRSKRTINDIGVKKIRKGHNVFTHCHSSTVISILSRAAKEKTHFELYNTETRPFFQGRITAKEMSKKGIKVHHFVDNAAEYAIRESDVVLVGCDAILSTGEIVNKVGTRHIAHLAEKQNVPVYVCTNSWKFDPKTISGYEEKIEVLDKKDIWEDAPRNVLLENPSFDIIPPSMITGVISELGIYPPTVFVEEVMREYFWMS